MVKNLPAMQETAGLVPASGRSPEDKNGNPLQYFCLKNPTDRGTWRATVHGIAELHKTEPAHTHHTGCYHRSSWDGPSLTWPRFLSSQHLASTCFSCNNSISIECFLQGQCYHHYQYPPKPSWFLVFFLFSVPQ